MASHFPPTSISGDEEFDENDSAIDFTGFEARRDEESDSKSEETSEDSTEAETPWTIELSNFEVSEFSDEPGLRFNLRDDAKADHYFLKVFGEQTVDLIVEETNRYARQSLRNNPSRLAAWENVSKEELKAYFGVCVIMGIDQLPRIADYWKDSTIKETLLFLPRTFLRENVYTANMGGVHRADQLRWYYVGRQLRKWYKYLFWFSFNLAACNAYILESESRVKRAQDLFRLELGKRLIGNFNSRGVIHSTKISGPRFENFVVTNGSRRRLVSFQSSLNVSQNGGCSDSFARVNRRRCQRYQRYYR